MHVSTVTPDDLKTPGHFDVVILEGVDACNHQALQNATETAKENGVTEATFLTINGRDVAKAVIEYAETNGCDHIVTGSNG